MRLKCDHLLQLVSCDVAVGKPTSTKSIYLYTCLCCVSVYVCRFHLKMLRKHIPVCYTPL